MPTDSGEQETDGVEHPDRIECGECGGEIIHDDYLYFVTQGFNCHGAPMTPAESKQMVVCGDCAPESIQGVMARD